MYQTYDQVPVPGPVAMHICTSDLQVCLIIYDYRYWYLSCLIRAEKWGVLSPQKLYYQEKRTLEQTAWLFDPVNHLSSSAHM